VGVHPRFGKKRFSNELATPADSGIIFFTLDVAIKFAAGVFCQCSSVFLDEFVFMPIVWKTQFAKLKHRFLPNKEFGSGRSVARLARLLGV
jgi:hypothetical protein